MVAAYRKWQYHFIHRFYLINVGGHLNKINVYSSVSVSAPHWLTKSYSIHQTVDVDSMRFRSLYAGPTNATEQSINSFADNWKVYEPKMETERAKIIEDSSWVESRGIQHILISQRGRKWVGILSMNWANAATIISIFQFSIWPNRYGRVCAMRSPFAPRWLKIAPIKMLRAYWK